MKITGRSWRDFHCEASRKSAEVWRRRPARLMFCPSWNLKTHEHMKKRDHGIMAQQIHRFQLSWTIHNATVWRTAETISLRPPSPKPKAQNGSLQVLCHSLASDCQVSGMLRDQPFLFSLCRVVQIKMSVPGFIMALWQHDFEEHEHVSSAILNLNPTYIREMSRNVKKMIEWFLMPGSLTVSSRCVL